MFLFRWLVSVFAVLGFILGSTLIYLGFFPVMNSPKPKVSLTNTIGCSSRNTSYKSTDIQDDDVNDLKNLLGANAPIEIIRGFGTSINSLTASLGSVTRINIEYCDVSESNDALINKFNSALEKDKKYYDYGAINDFIAKVNTLPYSTISNVDLKIPSRFARSNFCNTPIHKTNLYLLTIVDSGVSKKAVIFNIDLEDADGNKPEYKFFRNIVTSGQYIKSQIYCNG